MYKLIGWSKIQAVEISVGEKYEHRSERGGEPPVFYKEYDGDTVNEKTLGGDAYR